MSDRGSILISTANDIGEALVEKLGGEGYAPSVWDKEYNKLGIAEVDSAPALSVLEDSSETGTARGSILLSTANAIGAMLNKKYNTDRGFKPKEWASAASKLAPLPQKSAESASICAIEDGADDVPTKSLIVTIPPTLSGVSALTVENDGNLCDFDNYNVEANTNTTVALGADLTLKKGTYTLAFNISDTVTATRNRPCYVVNGNYTYADSDYKTSGRYSWTFTLADDTTLSIRWWAHTVSANITISNFMLTQGSTAHAYEQYQTPTTYTANLGRTIYGGEVDVVNGTGTDNCTNRNLIGDGFTWSYIATELSFPYFTIGSNAPDKASNKNFVCEGYVNNGNYRSNLQDGEIGVFNNTTGINRFCIRDDSCTTLEQFLEKNANTKITYEVTNPVEFTFDGQEIPTKDGYNAFWSDQGNTALDYYGEPEPYTRGTASGAIANVQSARTDLPFTQVKANIAPNLTGVESVEVKKAGKNLFNKENPNEVDGYITTTGFSTSNTSAKTIYIPIVGGATYTVSKTAGQRFSLATAEVIPSNNAVFTGRQANNTATSISITAGANDKYLWAWIYLDGTDAGTLDDMISSVQIEVGSTATEYTPYQEPAVYTADLGEPVYGGSVDLVTGEKVKTSARLKISDLNWSIQTVSGRSAFISGQVSNMPTTSPKIVLCDVLPYDGEKTIGGMTDKTLATWTNTFRIYDTDIADVTELISTYGNGYITYPIVTDIESSITPQVISPSEGVNNLWNNAGGDTDVEYFEQE